MRTERFELTRQKWEWLRPMLLGILPRGLAQSRLSALEEYSGPLLPFIREWAAALLQAYRQQIMDASDKYGSLVQGGVVLFCFAMAPDWSGSFVALIVVLLILIIRNAYTHGRERYRTDGITDAALTLLFLLAAEALTLQMAPSRSVPKDVFFKGAFACLPLLRNEFLKSREADRLGVVRPEHNWADDVMAFWNRRNEQFHIELNGDCAGPTKVFECQTARRSAGESSSQEGRFPKGYRLFSHVRKAAIAAFWPFVLLCSMKSPRALLVRIGNERLAGSSTYLFPRNSYIWI